RRDADDAFKEDDHVGITRPCTKHNFLVKDGKDLGPTIREAFHLAKTGRPGPVHVDLPKDILVKETDLVWPEKVHMRSYNPTYDGHPGQIKKAARLIARAKKPVFYERIDRKSTRLNSSHVAISYAVFCLKRKTTRTAG